jgi:hypothetical protein
VLHGTSLGFKIRAVRDYHFVIYPRKR